MPGAGWAPPVSAGSSTAPASAWVPSQLPPKVSTTTAATITATAARVTFSIRGRWTIRAIRSFMVRFPSLMVVAVRSSPVRGLPGTIMDTRVWP